MLDKLTNPWAARLRDALLDNSALRDGLADDEAQPLIDWGLQLADRLAAEMKSLPSDQHEARYEQFYEMLPKLLTRITWVTLHRAKKGADWTANMLRQINDLNRILHGADAPQLSAESIAAYAERGDQLSNGELVKELIAHLTPSEN